MALDPYDPDRVEKLRDVNAFRYCSGEELRGLLDPSPGWRVADFGSGTGLFTSELAPVVDTVYAVDARPHLHNVYRNADIPGNVHPVTADFATLPFPDDHLDGGVSIRTYHHDTQAALPEVARVIRPGGRFVIVDWSATGAGDREVRTDEEYLDVATVQAHLINHGFRITTANERRETFIVIGQRRPPTD